MCISQDADDDDNGVVVVVTEKRIARAVVDFFAGRRPPLMVAAAAAAAAATTIAATESASGHAKNRTSIASTHIHTHIQGECECAQEVERGREVDPGVADCGGDCGVLMGFFTMANREFDIESGGTSM